MIHGRYARLTALGDRLGQTVHERTDPLVAVPLQVAHEPGAVVAPATPQTIREKARMPSSCASMRGAGLEAEPGTVERLDIQRGRPCVHPYGDLDVPT